MDQGKGSSGTSRSQGDAARNSARQFSTVVSRGPTATPDTDQVSAALSSIGVAARTAGLSSTPSPRQHAAVAAVPTINHPAPSNPTGAWATPTFDPPDPPAADNIAPPASSPNDGSGAGVGGVVDGLMGWAMWPLWGTLDALRWAGASVNEVAVAPVMRYAGPGAIAGNLWGRFMAYTPQRARDLGRIFKNVIMNAAGLFGSAPGAEVLRTASLATESLAMAASSPAGRQFVVESATALVKAAEAMDTAEFKNFVQQAAVVVARGVDFAGTRFAKIFLQDAANVVVQLVELANSSQATVMAAEFTANVCHAMEMEYLAGMENLRFAANAPEASAAPPKKILSNECDTYRARADPLGVPHAPAGGRRDEPSSSAFPNSVDGASDQYALGLEQGRRALVPEVSIGEQETTRPRPQQGGQVGTDASREQSTAAALASSRLSAAGSGSLQQPDHVLRAEVSTEADARRGQAHSGVSSFEGSADGAATIGRVEDASSTTAKRYPRAGSRINMTPITQADLNRNVGVPLRSPLFAVSCAPASPPSPSTAASSPPRSVATTTTMSNSCVAAKPFIGRITTSTAIGRSDVRAELAGRSLPSTPIGRRRHHFSGPEVAAAGGFSVEGGTASGGGDRDVGGRARSSSDVMIGTRGDSGSGARGGGDFFAVRQQNVSEAGMVMGGLDEMLADANSGREGGRVGSHEVMSETGVRDAAHPAPADYRRDGRHLLPRFSMESFASVLRGMPLALEQQLDAPTQSTLQSVLHRAAGRFREGGGRGGGGVYDQPSGRQGSTDGGLDSGSDGRELGDGGTIRDEVGVARAPTPAHSRGEGWIQILSSILFLFFAIEGVRHHLFGAAASKHATRSTAAPSSMPHSPSPLGGGIGGYPSGSEVETTRYRAVFLPQTCRDPATGVTMTIWATPSGPCVSPEQESEDGAWGGPGSPGCAASFRLCSAGEIWGMVEGIADGWGSSTSDKDDNDKGVAHKERAKDSVDDVSLAELSGRGARKTARLQNGDEM